MIFNYNDFLITESNIVYSDIFRNILKEIDSPIAKNLIDIENNDIDSPSNYFDVSDKNDTLTFISDKKSKSLLENNDVILKNTKFVLKNEPENQEIFKKIGYTYNYNQPEYNSNGFIDNVIEYKGITYCLVIFNNFFKSVVNLEGLIVKPAYGSDIWTKSRQNIKIGRIIKTLLNKYDPSQEFTKSEIEDFVNKYKSQFSIENDSMKRFDLVSGTDIAKWYSSSNYYGSRYSQRGTLGKSCMASVSSTYFDIYVKNPDVCKLLILKSKDDDLIVGRAIVWKLNSPDITFMDRIYTIEESDVNLFRKYAIENGWEYKLKNDSSEHSLDLVSSKGINTYVELNVKINKSQNYRNYPYLDTLCFFHPESGLLSTDSSTLELKNTDGDIECHICGNPEYCQECGGDGYIPCEYCSYGKVDCSKCEGSGHLDCKKCEGSGQVDCETCDGTGEDSEGEMCQTCYGDGKVDCETCDGDGKVDCNLCDGNGNEECEHCDGNGNEECESCEGTGESMCPNCDQYRR